MATSVKYGRSRNLCWFLKHTVIAFALTAMLLLEVAVTPGESCLATSSVPSTSQTTACSCEPLADLTVSPSGTNQAPGTATVTVTSDDNGCTVATITCTVPSGFVPNLGFFENDASVVGSPIAGDIDGVASANVQCSGSQYELNGNTAFNSYTCYYISSCPDPMPLFATEDGLTNTLTPTGSQPVGSTVTASCTNGDTIYTVTFDDGTKGRADQDLNGSRDDSIVLTCEASGEWETTVTDSVDNTPPVVLTGTVSTPGHIICQLYFVPTT